MGELFSVYLQNSLQLSVIALLMLAFSPLLAHRYSAKCRYYLWAVIFVALILPVRTKITVSLPEVFQAVLPQSMAATASGTAVIADTVKTWDWHQHAGLLWAVGVLCFLGWHLFQHFRFLSAIRRWSEKTEDACVLKQFALTKAELKIREHIAIKSCACIKTPMVVGLLRPVVLLPQYGFSPDELSLILKHELVHYKRKDLWYKVLIMIASAIHWFNPVVHLMTKSVMSLCEISCDEEVLRKFDAKGRARYGEAIIGVARNRSAYKTPLSTNFYSGTQGMKKRIYAMMDMSRKRFSPVLFVVVFMIAICGTTAFGLSPAQTDGISRNFNKAMTATAGPNQVDSKDSSFPTSSGSDGEQSNPGKLSSNGNILLPNGSEPTLIPDTLAEPSQEQTYAPDMFQLIFNKEKS